MRVIGGISRGSKLFSLEGENTRPTLDRVKESLFNIIQNELSESIVLDLFAGSGALGIEALSRGASFVTFVDNSKDAVDIIRKNIEKTKFNSKSEILNSDFKSALERNKNKKYDLIFLDPPYKTNFIVESIELIIEYNILADNGTVILETDIEKEILQKLNLININVVDIRKYGRASLIFVNGRGK